MSGDLLSTRAAGTDRAIGGDQQEDLLSIVDADMDDNLSIVSESSMGSVMSNMDFYPVVNNNNQYNQNVGRCRVRQTIVERLGQLVPVGMPCRRSGSR